MASLIGAHFSRNGIKQFPARVVLSMYGNGIGGDETHPDTIVVLRDTRVFPSGEAPPDFHTFDPVASGISWDQYGRYWYSERTEVTPPPDSDMGFPNFKACWDTLPPADYYTICNEQGGGEGNTPAEKDEIRRNVQRLCDIERAIAYAANADGRKCCVGNFAGGSPGDFELWKEIIAPFILEAWQNGGNIYGRHVYADQFIDANGNVTPGQPQRVINELKHLQFIGYGGGVVLTECGLDGGYGVADLSRFTYQVQAWEAALRPYADILMGFCFWECGDTGFHADYTNHLKTLIPFMNNSYLGKWEPAETQQPPTGGGGEPVTTYKNVGKSFTERRGGATHARLAFFEEFDQGGGVIGRRWLAQTDLYELPANANLVTAVQYEEETEKPTDPNPPSVELTLPQGSIGVDVSYWQGSFNWASSGADFGIIRCSDGLTANSTTHDENGVDRQFWPNVDKLAALGIPWSIYHFLRPGSIPQQADKVLSIVNQLKGAGKLPRTAVFDNGVKLPSVWIDVEDPLLSSADVQGFYNLLTSACTVGIYTGKPVWSAITSGAAVWWSNVPLWIAAYGSNDGNVPNWANGPSLPNGWSTAVLWQYTSNPIDKNIAGPYPTVNPPPPPPTGKTVNFTNYLMPPANIGQWLVLARAEGGTVDHQTQLHNGIVYIVKSAAFGKTNYEELRINNGYIERRYDTSPKDGHPYKLDDGHGWSKWMPVTMTEGQTYLRTPVVTSYNLAANCEPISSGASPSYIKFAKFHPVFTLPNGRTYNDVAELHWQWSPGDAVLERYFVAPNGRWYVQWGDAESLHYVEDEPQGRSPLPLVVVPCLQ